MDLLAAWPRRGLDCIIAVAFDLFENRTIASHPYISPNNLMLNAHAFGDI